MGKSKAAKKRKNQINQNVITLVIILVGSVALCTGLLFQSNDLRQRLTAYDAKAAQLTVDIENEKLRTEEIKQLKEYMKTEQYAEEVAREKLGLVKENETVFKEEKDTE
ncbi:MAG: septum formation initiator family protein [Eubacteriales bacterium]|nr:septum formation initiator family protein [Eubacteriales bacterium]